MPLILSIITAPIIYFGLGWIASSIYYSVNPVGESVTLHDIMSTSIFIYACVAAAYNGIMGSYAAETDAEENITGWLGLGIPGLAWFFCGYILPVSPGATVLTYILNLGSMLYFGYRGWDKILDRIC